MVGFATDLWNEAKQIISTTEKHPFLLSMVDGTLDMKCFRYYVIQDVLYLHDFSDCLRRLGEHPNITIDEATTLKSLSHSAMMETERMHNVFCKQWNIDATGVQQMPNTLLYSSFLYRIVNTRTHAEGLATLLPCYWVYCHVGKRILKLRDELGER
uniref:Thiaminase-2/PQQC domain-containing protein n=1 Tax=Entomoneis paludosa TaxID=265537 RepID=A0A7S2VC71_9STRA|mmetsp:Transcript_1660/g.3553  ORF Transcript_1660/g.3553 Transcript_1660/m.3553 type:complete len:156 (+) Transcript_1660:66-533(+)